MRTTFGRMVTKPALKAVKASSTEVRKKCEQTLLKRSAAGFDKVLVVWQC